MLRRILPVGMLAAVALCLLPATPLAAQSYQRIWGYCAQLGTSPLAISTSCTVNIYNTGTMVNATVYSDAIGTPLSLPTTANSQGVWAFYYNASANQNYDVRLSGGVPALVPYTLPLAAFLGGSGGGGTPCTSVATSIQFNNGGVFGCVVGSAIANATGALTYTAGADTTVPVDIEPHSGTQTGKLLILDGGIAEFDPTTTTPHWDLGTTDNLGPVLPKLFPPATQTHLISMVGGVPNLTLGMSGVVGGAYVSGTSNCPGTGCATGVFGDGEGDFALPNGEVNGGQFYAESNQTTGSIDVVGTHATAQSGTTSGGTVRHLIALQATLGTFDTGAITDIYGLQIDTINGASAIPSATTLIDGVHISGMDPTNTYGATQTNAIDIDDQGSGKYDIYEASTSAKNVLYNLQLGGTGGPTVTAYQGTDTKALTSGTINGTGALLYTDSNGGATTAASFVYNCGVMSGSSPQTCASSAAAVPKIFYGQGALVSGTPSAVTINSISPTFTSTTSFYCTVTNATTAADALKVTNTSTSSITVTGPNTITDSFSFICVGT